jgi:hypothetical protein
VNVPSGTKNDEAFSTFVDGVTMTVDGLQAAFNKVSYRASF